jgi:dihydrofolate reductase
MGEHDGDFRQRPRRDCSTEERDRETESPILVAGSGTLVGTLLANDLVDELRLMVFPTVLG